MSGLKACPWCHGTDIVEYPVDGAIHRWMTCNNQDCCAEGPISKDDPEGAWNCRPEPVWTAEAIAEVERKADELAPAFARFDEPDWRETVRDIYDLIVAKGGDGPAVGRLIVERHGDFFGPSVFPEPVAVTAPSPDTVAALVEAARAIDRLSLIITSSVRYADRLNSDQISDAVLALRAALAPFTGEPT